MKKYKNIILLTLAVVALLAFVFWYGGDAPGLRGWKTPAGNSVEVSKSTDAAITQTVDYTDINTHSEDAAVSGQGKRETDTESNQPLSTQYDEPEDLPDVTNNTEELPEAEEKSLDDNKDFVQEDASYESKEQQTENNAYQETEATGQAAAEKDVPPGQADENNQDTAVQNTDRAYSEANGMVFDEETGKDKYMTEAVPEGKPVPIEPQDAVISDKKYTCTLSVRCDTILDNISWLDKEKLEIVPEDGAIFEEKTVEFYEGESVFNLLLREMKRNKIHMEFENTPIYNSAYIEGIANLYEFDCGELSGWMYKVNGWFPNYGCSRYALKPGDRVEWVYTCDLGVDVGGHYSTRGNVGK